MKNRHDHLAVATHFTNVTTTHPWLLNSWYKVEMTHITEVVTPPCWSTWDSFQQGASHLLWVIDLACECQWWGSLPAAAASAKSLQSCPTLRDPIDGSPPGSPIPGILQARTLEWVAISFSNAGKGKVKVKSLSRVWLLETPWTAAYQALPSMGFSRQEYWSGVPLPSPLDCTACIK